MYKLFYHVQMYVRFKAKIIITMYFEMNNYNICTYTKTKYENKKND